jgi:hypothetical protein
MPPAAGEHLPIETLEKCHGVLGRIALVVGRLESDEPRRQIPPEARPPGSSPADPKLKFKPP